ncbi:biopolymer transport protein ExbD [Alcanivorax sp. S71-1-4]|uniref:ExbD/TolR family protein n=1 Tax=Alcanivorax sp. S71-1-4 TaxID=1177159 RepID=UPI001356BD8E|nr:biopolymer transporter ExbD [Alcanivorax sp. S71-1-4]KAF0809463.1 biopolymer transport protein ExbD [Alcanivorax sp. S71-1-4]
MKFRRQRLDEVSVNLTPLIDVVFLLLIFFMVSTTFTRETRLGVVLPEASGLPQAEMTDQVEVVISAAGEYRINGEQLVRADADTLRSALLALSREGTDRPLMITADADSSHQSVVRVMDVAGQLGFVNITITTQEPATD